MWLTNDGGRCHGSLRCVDSTCRTRSSNAILALPRGIPTIRRKVGKGVGKGVVDARGPRQASSSSKRNLQLCFSFVRSLSLSSPPFSAKCKTRVRKLEKALREKGVCDGVLPYRKARAS